MVALPPRHDPGHRLVVALLLAAMLVVAGPAPTARAVRAGARTTPCGAASCDVTTTPGGYVGSLLLPPGSRPDPPGLPGLAGSCDGCEWILEPACQTPGTTGRASCNGALMACPAPAMRMALFLRRPPASVFRRVGTFCADPGVPLQPGALLPGVRDRFVRLLPGLRPSFQPVGRGVVNLPVVFATGQVGSIGRPRFVLAGRRVELEAAATWRWRFGDGVELVTRRPGGAWPDTDVAHAYGRPGRFPVVVTATWAGRFWVDGAGPFTVTGAPVTQQVMVDVPVVEARAVLTAPALGPRV